MSQLQDAAVVSRGKELPPGE